MMQQMEVVVPDGIKPGMPFAVNTPSGQMQVTCPDDAKARDSIMLNMPAVAAPVPMVMGAAAATTGVTVAANTPPLNISISLDLSKRYEFDTKRANLPPSLQAKGMPLDEWQQVMACLEKVMQANFFYSHGGANAECCYWCIPGGPIQCALCMLNPITCVLCMAPVDKAKNEVRPEVDRILNKYSLTIKFNEGSLVEETACIVPLYR